MELSVIRAIDDDVLLRETRNRAIPEEEKEAIRNLQEIWNAATDEKRFLISATAPETTLQAIPEVEECWAAKEAAKAATRSDDEAESTDNMDTGPADYISITSSIFTVSQPEPA